MKFTRNFMRKPNFFQFPYTNKHKIAMNKTFTEFVNLNVNFNIYSYIFTANRCICEH